MAMSVKRAGEKNQIRFKEQADEDLWLSNQGPSEVRDWIRTMNHLSVFHAGRGIVVTSWVRNDDSAHQRAEAVDIRRLSGANKFDPDPYTLDEVIAIEADAAAQGIPIFIINEGKPNEHWHLGRVKYANG